MSYSITVAKAKKENLLQMVFFLSSHFSFPFFVAYFDFSLFFCFLFCAYFDFYLFVVVAMLAHFTYFSEWVASVICLCERTKERAKILLKFLEIATKLKVLNNFFGVLQIFTGKKKEKKKKKDS
jgi:hypothetical protein